MRDAVEFLCWSALRAGFYDLNQRLVDRKGLDHRPYLVPARAPDHCPGAPARWKRP